MADTVQTILKRRSIRKYTDKKADTETIKTILKCGMSGPSAVNARDWCFIVVEDKDRLKQWAGVCGRASQIVEGSAFSVLICNDGQRAFARAPEYGIINAAIAGQNMILAAEDLGLGSVWLGIWPQQEKVNAQKEFFNLPDDVTPHSIIAFGYPDEDRSGVPHTDYEESQVHFNEW
ncbi:MAG: nitroreductase family protein [Erysipelotrichaceae bacterium]|nr:nitroreductase family protein [Erysipelotrichaceae bacterium]